MNQLDLENSHRYAKLATRLLEKAQEAAARGELTLAETRAENAKSFLARATRALVEGPAVREMLAMDQATFFNENREPASTDLRRHALTHRNSDYLLDPKTHEEMVAKGWLKEAAPGVWVWDHEQMDRDS